ncbi:hypothetical protein A8508_004945, partial [Escherichia coli]|nr:hypothetical protein [Escherichia coli]ELO4120513.1 hypothetical protein [Escherichia coli]
MSKKLAKTVLSAAMAGVLFGVSFDIMAADDKGEVFYSALKGTGGAHGEIFKIFYNENNKTAHIDWGNSGDVVKERNKPIPLLSKIDVNGNVTITSADGSTTFTVYDKEVHDFMKAAASKNLDIKKNKDAFLTEQNIRDLYNRVSAIQQMETNVGLDEYGNVAVTPNEIKERVSLQRYLAWESANSTIVANELEAQKGKLDAQKGELEAQKRNLGELTTRTDKIDAAAAATA